MMTKPRALKALIPSKVGNLKLTVPVNTGSAAFMPDDVARGL